jgi:hypothetical protein
MSSRKKLVTPGSWLPGVLPLLSGSSGQGSSILKPEVEVVEGAILWIEDHDPELEEYHLYLRDPEGWWTAWVKEDGCIDLRRFHNDPAPEQEEPTAQIVDYIHLCSLDDTIERLQDLRRLVVERFGEDWRA